MFFSQNVSVDRIISFFEDDFTDIKTQSSWDFSGKQIYLGDHSVSAIFLALDPSRDVIRQAIDRGCELLITHHPLFFKPLQGIDITRQMDSGVISAIRNGLSILSYHTNLDVSPNGINHFLLRKLNARDEGLFTVEGAVEYVKFVVFTPLTHENAVLDAIDAAGGGRVGNYRRCAFSVEGTGTFVPLEGATPFLGKTDTREYVREVRQEALVPAALIHKVVAAVKTAHPYETPAFDIIRVHSPEEYGFGRIGTLETECDIQTFAALLKEKLALPDLRVNMPYCPAPVKRFAISGGSGGGLWKECVRRKVDILVTGDVKHHDAIDARDAGICVIDIGHFYSERIYMSHLADVLKDKFHVNVYLADEQPSLFTW